MSPYPTLNVVSTPTRLYLSTGSHIHSFAAEDTQFAPLASTSVLTESETHTGLVRLIAVSKDERWACSVADDKKLKVWSLSEDGTTVSLSSTRQVLKKISTLAFISSNEIIIGDRLGDAFTYPLHPDASSADVATTERKVDLHADPALNPDGKLILGHTSPLTALFLSEDERYIVTADRDEHIRISRYPEGEIVERFLLGHKNFVSALLPLAAPKSLLLSAGGDDSIHVWDFPSPTTSSGALLYRIPILEVVRPFFKVEAPKRYGRVNEKGEKPERQPGSGGLCVLKLLQIGGRAVFYSLGATALFSFSLADLSSSTPVTALDLGHPILDFSVNNSATVPTLFVSIDTAGSPAPGLASVFVGTDSLSVIDTPSSLLTSPHLLSSPAPPPAPLEKKAGKTKAPRSPDVNLNLYQLLAEMPKWSKEGEDDDGEGGDDVEEKAISKKETGRRKNNGGVPSLPNLGAPHKKHRVAAAAAAAPQSGSATPQPEEDDEAAMMNEA